MMYSKSTESFDWWTVSKLDHCLNHLVHEKLTGDEHRFGWLLPRLKHLFLHLLSDHFFHRGAWAFVKLKHFLDLTLYF